MGTVFTDAGKAITANRVKGIGDEPNYVAWGTGAGDAAAANTTLFTEASEVRVACATSVVTTGVADDTYQAVGTLTADANKTITNVGLFDAATAGDMLMKSSFAGFALETGEAIQFTLKVQYT